MQPTKNKTHSCRIEGRSYCVRRTV